VKTILALDLGTTTGWAYRSRSGGITAGSWLLMTDEAITKAAKTRMDRRLDARIPVLHSKLVSVWRDQTLNEPGFENPVDFLVFEDVQFSRYTKQTQLWASFRAVVWLYCRNYNIQVDCCPVTTLKKFGTGSGKANKDFMMQEAARLFPNVPIVDDNCADALHLLQWAITITKRAK